MGGVSSELESAEKSKKLSSSFSQPTYIFMFLHLKKKKVQIIIIITSISEINKLHLRKKGEVEKLPLLDLMFIWHLQPGYKV